MQTTVEAPRLTPEEAAWASRDVPIEAIKSIRARTGLGLYEAKAYFDATSEGRAFSVRIRAAGPRPLLRAADGVDAGVYTVIEPLTIEAVRERAAQARGLAAEMQGLSTGARMVPLRLRLDLYRDVLGVFGADRGPSGALARAALEAEEK